MRWKKHRPPKWVVRFLLSVGSKEEAIPQPGMKRGTGHLLTINEENYSEDEAWMITKQFKDRQL
ncbi:MAG: hypothetical protein AAFP89_23190 [Bacteroidota bacterium]